MDSLLSSDLSPTGFIHSMIAALYFLFVQSIIIQALNRLRNGIHKSMIIGMKLMDYTQSGGHGNAARIMPYFVHNKFNTIY